MNKKDTARIMTISNFKLCYRVLARKTTLGMEGGAVGMVFSVEDGAVDCGFQGGSGDGLSFAPRSGIKHFGVCPLCLSFSSNYFLFHFFLS